MSPTRSPPVAVPPPPPPLPETADIGIPQRGKVQRSKSVAKEKGKGRSQRGGRGRGRGRGVGGGGGGGGESYPDYPAQGARRKRSPIADQEKYDSSGRGGGNEQLRGGRGRNGAAGREARRGGKGGKGGGAKGGGGSSGGGGGGRAPTPSSTYALSKFQNSPDPKSIPIPSLRHFSLNPEVSTEEEDIDAEAGSPPSLSLRGYMEGSREDEYGSGWTGLHTPPPATSIVARTQGLENRSSAKKAEDDIKRMLRLG